MSQNANPSNASSTPVPAETAVAPGANERARFARSASVPEDAGQAFLLLLGPALQLPMGSQEPSASQAPGQRQRLLERVAGSKRLELGMHTCRVATVPKRSLGAGVSSQVLYEAKTGMAMRRGQPLRVQLIDLEDASVWPAPAAQQGACHREFLVLSGAVLLQSMGEQQNSIGTGLHMGQSLALRDYHASPAHLPCPSLRAQGRARVLLRESQLPTSLAPTAAFTVQDAAAGWPAYGPGIQRRVLWQGGGQATMLYLAQPGALVPHHRHGHDEECFMVQGSLFLDDCLLQEGDYQIAPVGTGHLLTHTDEGAVLFAHGDEALDFVA